MSSVVNSEQVVDLDWDNYNSPVTTDGLNGEDEVVSPVENGQEKVKYKPRPIKQPVPTINFLIDHLIFELEASLEFQLDVDLVEFIRTTLLEHEECGMRKLEEKDVAIGELKQSLLELTEKRFRAHLNDETHQTPLVDIKNIEFMLNEKENQLNAYANELRLRENEVTSLKETIKQQDDIILSHNSNIYELKNSTETVQKSKQESFRLLNEDLTRKQKLIDDQAQVIKSLKEKIETLEEQYSESRIDLEKRLNEKETDLQVKIAQFESNLHEGKHYFEDMLAEKDLALKEQASELNRLRERLNKYESVENGDDLDNNENNQSAINDSSILLTSSMLNQSTAAVKYDSENIKSIKSLYEHQIDLLKVKIEMLEKTCADYRQGIKDMNRNFGFQQQNDEITSMQIFKDLMQQLQKTNVQLETERIDLQVKVSKMKEELETLRVEKENVAKKLASVDQHNQKLSAERIELEITYKRLMESKAQEINSLNEELYGLKLESDRLRAEYENLVQISQEYEILKVNNQQLVQHYEQLYQQATEIVNGNQLLNEQVNNSKVKIEALEAEIEDYKITFEKLKQSNSELNTEKINLEMKLSDAETILKEQESAITELHELRDFKSEATKLRERLVDVEAELVEKTELIDQLNQAKDFLAENNSKLLTNNIKMQIFVESLGVETDLENSPKVKEYELMCEKVNESEQMLNELRIKLKELEIEYLNYKMESEGVIEEKNTALADLEARVEKLSILVEKTDIWTQYDEETQEFKIHVYTQYDIDQREFRKDAGCQCDLVDSSSLSTTLIKTTDHDSVDRPVAKVEETVQNQAPSMWEVEEDILDGLTNIKESLTAELPPTTEETSLDATVSKKRIEELEAKNEELADQLKQFEFNFIEIQNENDAYLNEINELKERIEDLKLKTQSQHSTPTSSSTKTRTNKPISHGNNRIELVDQWSTSNEAELPIVADSLPSDYLEQLKQYEANIESIQNENDSLLDEIDKLNEKIRALEKSSSDIQIKYDELNSKLAATEKQNLKLKAKLKQLMSSNKDEKREKSDDNTSSSQSVEKVQQQVAPVVVNSAHMELNSSTSSASTEIQTSLSWSDLAEMEGRNAGLTAVIKQLEVLLSSDNSTDIIQSNHNESNLSLPQLNNNPNNDLDASNTGANDKRAATEGEESLIDAARLVSFGAKIASQSIEQQLMADLSILSSELSNLLVTHQIKMAFLRQTSMEYQTKCESLELENEKLRDELASTVRVSSLEVQAEVAKEPENVQESKVQEPTLSSAEETVKTAAGWDVEDWDNLNEEENNSLETKVEEVKLNMAPQTLKLDSNEHLEKLSETLAQREAELVESRAEYENLVAEFNKTRVEFEQAQARQQNLAQYQQFELEQQISELNQILNEKDNELTKKNADYELLLQRIEVQSNESRLSAETMQREVSRQADYRLEELENNLMAKETELTSLRSEYESVKQACERVRSELNEACNENETLNQQFEDEKARLNQILSERQASLDTRSQELDALAQNYDALKRELEDTYSNFEQEMNRLNQQVAQRDNELARMNASLLDQQYQFEKAQSEIVQEKQDQVDKLNEELEGLKKKYDTLRVKAHAMKEKLKRHETLGGGSPSPVPREEATNSTSSMGSATGVSEEAINNIHKSYLEQIKQYEENFAELEATNEKLSSQIDDIKRDHDQAVKQVHQSYLDQLKQYESSVQSINEENDTLRAQIQTLNEKLNSMSASASVNAEEINSKLKNYEEMQKLNLKLKAKVKLLLAKDKERQQSTIAHPASNDVPYETQLLVSASSSHTSHIFDDDRSGCATPVFNQSPAQIQSQQITMSTVDTQTLLDFDELIEKASSLESMRAHYEQRIESLTESNTQLSQLVEELRLKTSQESSKQRIESNTDDNVNSYTILEGQDSEETIRDLKEKLESAQQMNLKLKAKLKQMIKSKNEASESTSSSTPVVQSEQSTQTDPDLVQIQQPAEFDSVELDQLRQFRMESEPYIKSMQEVNYTLNMELESYKQFKAETDAYIANVLSENARLVSEVSQVAEKKPSVDFELQVDDEEKQDLIEANAILKEQLESERSDCRSLSAELEELKQQLLSTKDSGQMLDSSTQTDLETHNEADLVEIDSLNQELESYKQFRAEMEAYNSSLARQNEELSETINQLNSYKDRLIDGSCQTEEQVRSESDMVLIDTLNQELDGYKQYRIDMEAYTASLLSQISLMNEKLVEIDQHKQGLVEATVQTETEVRSEQDVALIDSLTQQIEQFSQYRDDMGAYTATLLSQIAQLNEKLVEIDQHKQSLVEASIQTDVDSRSEEDTALINSLNQEIEQYVQYKADMDAYTANLVNENTQLNQKLAEYTSRKERLVETSIQTEEVEFKTESDVAAVEALTQELEGYRQYRVEMETYTANLIGQITQLSQTIAETSSAKEILIDGSSQTDEEYRNPADVAQIDSLVFQLDQFNQYKTEMDTYVAAMTSQNVQLAQTVNELSSRRDQMIENSAQTEGQSDNTEELIERIKTLDVELANNKSELEQLRDQNNDLMNEVFDLKQARLESEDQVNNLVAENANLSHQISQIQSRVFASVQLQTDDDQLAIQCEQLGLELDHVKQDRDRLVQEISEFQSSLPVIKSKQSLHAEVQTDSYVDDEKESLRSSNQTLSQEIVQFKQFKTDCESYISNLLNEYAKVAASLQQYEQQKSLTSGGEGIKQVVVSRTDTSVQVDLIENRDSNDLQLVIDSLKQANLILNQELSELKKQQKASAASATSERIKEISQADSQFIFSLQTANKILNHELSELKQIDQNRKPSITSSSNTPPLSPTRSSGNIDYQTQLELSQLKQVKLELEQNISSLTFYYNEAQAKIAKQSESFMEMSKRLTDSEMLIKQKQSTIDELVRQKSTYELQIENLNLELSQLRQQKERLNALMMSSSASHINDDTDMSTNTSLNGSFVYSNRNSTLETQLGFCREKTDNIVAKLGLLKKQNETLNSKIQLIKSLMKEERH